MTEMNNPGASDPAAAGDSIYRAPQSDTSVAPEGDLLDAYLGHKNADYYRRKFDQFESGEGSVSWNWPSFLVTTVWLLYRKMWLWAVGYWLLLPIALIVLSGILAAVTGDPGLATIFYYGMYILIGFILVPTFANKLYYNHAQKKLDKVRSTIPEGQQQALEAARVGGTSNVVVVVVPIFLVAFIGILAAISIPAYQDYTIRAQVAEGLSLASGPKMAVADYYSNNSDMPPDNEAAGLAPGMDISGQYVASVEVDNGVIFVTYGNTANPLIFGESLQMVPDITDDNMVDWYCSSEAIAARHLPAACRP